MLTGIVMFVLGYLTHKYKDVIVVELNKATAKIQAFLDSKR
jgi:hypothetical protein